MNAARCHLCSQIAGEADNDLLSRVLGDRPYVRHVLLESPSFAVIPSIGGLAPGHVLLCPRTHVCSFARLQPDHDAEYEAVATELDAILTAVFGQPVHQFEHGMSADGRRVLCTVDHAHQHFVPTPVDVMLRLGREAEWAPLDPGLEALRSCVGAREYILYRPPQSQALLTVAPNGFESQYLRRVFATELDLPEWDWRRDPRVPTLEVTVRALSGLRLSDAAALTRPSGGEAIVVS